MKKSHECFLPQNHAPLLDIIGRTHDLGGSIPVDSKSARVAKLIELANELVFQLKCIQEELGNINEVFCITNEV
jgi:hypothetical protein